ncbi:MAG: hypothetical protein AAB903_00245 [Patescibacteria group bacterium]
MEEPFFKSPWAEDQEISESPRPVLEPIKKQTAPKTSFPVLPLVIGGGAILIIAASLFLMLQLVGQAPESATVSVSSPSEVLLGQPFDFEIKVQNDSSEILRKGKLSVFLPPEINFAGQNPSKRVHEEAVGDIEQLGITSREIKLIAASGTESVSRIQARFSYVQSGATAQFERSKTVEVLIGPPAVTLDFTTPENILSGGNFDTKITITNRTNENIQDLGLVLTLPKNYTLISSNQSSTATSTWTISDLKRGEIKTLIVTGNLIGQESEFINMTASLRRTEGTEEYVVSEKTGSFSITAPPLALTIRPSTNSGFARIGEQVSYVVSLKNNTQVSLENLTIKATLVGDLFNLSSVTSNGLFNAVNNTITWNSNTAPSLLRLIPGETQGLTFTVSLKNQFPIARQSDKNFILKVNGSAESPTPIPNVSSEKTLVLAKSETKVAGLINFQSKVYYKDPASKIASSGPYPPRANQTTRYIVYWTLRNTGTDMSRIEVSSYLEPYSRIVGKPTSNTETTPIYNSASGQVVWRISKLLATQGTLGDPVQAVFQVETTPPSPYIGHTATILKTTTIEAMDDFTGREFGMNVLAVPSSLPDDQSLGNLDRTVQP